MSSERAEVPDVNWVRVMEPSFLGYPWGFSPRVRYPTKSVTATATKMIATVLLLIPHIWVGALIYLLYDVCYLMVINVVGLVE